MTGNRIITYLRVSTQSQGADGLGIAAQRTAIKHFIKDKIVVAEFVEVETGTKKKKRIELEKAINLCKQENATLLIAKLDRLSRNVAFVANLLDSGVDFIAADMPQANRLTIHIISAIAEHEAAICSSRTRNALKELKAKGVKLGNENNFSQEGRRKGADVNKQKALSNENNQRSTAMICMLKKTHSLSFEKIAKRLNYDGFVTANCKPHTATSVRNLFLRSNKCNNVSN